MQIRRKNAKWSYKDHGFVCDVKDAEKNHPLIYGSWRNMTRRTSDPEYQAKKPAYNLIIDFGTQGKKCSSVQITKNYSVEELSGYQVIAVFNLGKKKIGPFTSEVLVMGAEDKNGNIALLKPDGNIHNGALVN